MADTTTIITGVADGAFENAFGDIPQWATEETLEEIGITLTKLLKTQNLALAQLVKSAGAKGQALKPEDLAKLSDEVQELYKNFKKVNDDEPKRRKRDREEEDKHKRTLTEWRKDLFSWKTLQTGIIGAGDSIKKAMTDNVNTFDELYRSGINVMTGFDNASSGFEALRQLALKTNIRFTELAPSIIKFNTTINKLGLARFGDTIADTQAELRQFGFTGKEAGELLGAYMESQRGYNDATTRNQAQLNKDLVRFGERMTKLSQATGTLRTKLIEDIAAISESIEASLLYAQTGRDATESTIAFIASFKDKSIGQAFLKMMTDQIKPLNSTFMQFQKSGFGGFGIRLQRFLDSIKGISDPKEQARRMSEFTKMSMGEFAAMRPILQLQAEAGNQEAAAALKTVTAMEQQSRAFTETGKVSQAGADATADASAKFRNELESLEATYQKAFAPTLEMMQMFSATLGTVNSGINSVINALGAEFLAITGVTLALAALALKISLVSSLMDTLIGGGGKGGAGGGKGGGKLGGAVGWAAAAAIMLGLGAAVDTAAGSLGVGKNVLDEQRDKANWDRMSSLEKVESGLARSIEGIGNATVFDNFANEAAAARIKAESEYLDKKAGITTPPGGKIGESSATPPSELAPAATPGTPTAPAVTAPTPGTPDINSVLVDHGKILTQILDASNTLISVNKEILKFTRVQV